MAIAARARPGISGVAAGYSSAPGAPRCRSARSRVQSNEPVQLDAAGVATNCSNPGDIPARSACCHTSQGFEVAPDGRGLRPGGAKGMEDAIADPKGCGRRCQWLIDAEHGLPHQEGVVPLDDSPGAQGARRVAGRPRDPPCSPPVRGGHVAASAFPDGAPGDTSRSTADLAGSFSPAPRPGHLARLDASAWVSAGHVRSRQI